MDTYFLLVSLCLSTTTYVSLSIFLSLLWHQTLNCNTLYKMLLCRMKLKTKWFCVSIYSMCAYVWMCIMKKLGESDKDFHSYFPSLFFVSLHWSSPVMTQPLPRVRASVSLCVKTVECMRACVRAIICLSSCTLYPVYLIQCGSGIWLFSSFSPIKKRERQREWEGEIREQGVNYHLFLLPPFKGEIKAAPSFLCLPSIPPFFTPLAPRQLPSDLAC